MQENFICPGADMNKDLTSTRCRHKTSVWMAHETGIESLQSEIHDQWSAMDRKQNKYNPDKIILRRL